MKKLTVGLAVLLSGYAANSFAALPTGASSRCDVCVPSYCGGFTFGLMGLYWRVSSPELEFANSFDKFNEVTTDDAEFNGSFRHNRHRYDWAWRANIGYIFPCSGNDITLTYTNYSRSRRNRVDGPSLPTFFPLSQIGNTMPFTWDFPLSNIGIEGTAVTTNDAGNTNNVSFSGNVEHPCTLTVDVGPNDIKEVHARTRFELNTWDLDVGQSVNIGCNTRLHWFGGLRWANLKRNVDSHVRAKAKLKEKDNQHWDDPFAVIGSFNGTVTSSSENGLTGTTDTAIGAALVNLNKKEVANIRANVDTRSRFNGIGPSFGIDGEYNLCGGFGIVGYASTSLLVGEANSHLHSRIAIEPEKQIKGTALVTAPFLATTFGGVESAVANVTTNEKDLKTREVRLSFHHPDETRVVPNLEAKLGVNWTYQFCNCSRSKVSIEVAYLVSHYFNVVDRNSIIEAVAPEFRTRRTLDISFDGPVVGVQVAL